MKRFDKYYSDLKWEPNFSTHLAYALLKRKFCLVSKIDKIV